MRHNAFIGKVCVITGAGSGIGRALAVELARAGARLALSDVSESGLAETTRVLPPTGDVRTYRLDVADCKAVFAHADAVKRDFGRADIVINNAGVTVVGTIENTTIAEFEWQIAINLWGVIYGTKAFLPMLLAQDEGHIVNMSSVFGIVATPCQSAYHVSKFGVRGFTECLSRELEGTSVKTSCVYPGGIRTNIDRMARRAASAGAREDAALARVGSVLATPADECARGILSGIARGRQRILVGSSSRSIDWLQRLLPSHYGGALKLLKGL